MLILKDFLPSILSRSFYTRYLKKTENNIFKFYFYRVVFNKYAHFYENTNTYNKKITSKENDQYFRSDFLMIASRAL